MCNLFLTFDVLIYVFRGLYNDFIFFILTSPFNLAHSVLKWLVAALPLPLIVEIIFQSIIPSWWAYSIIFSNPNKWFYNLLFHSQDNYQHCEYNYFIGKRRFLLFLIVVLTVFYNLLLFLLVILPHTILANENKESNSVHILM